VLSGINPPPPQIDLPPVVEMRGADVVQDLLLDQFVHFVC
jgi:hypothetical protein